MTEEFKQGDAFGDFTILRLLGKGGMGRVYLVQDASGHLFAMKELDAASANESAVKRFMREARLSMGVHHSNIIKTYGIFEDENSSQNYILMEYAPGGTLADKISKEGPLGIRDAVRIVYQISCALEAAHAKGIVHRDIKPANIMFGADGSAKLADLGIARREGGIETTMVTQAGVMIGTPAYMAPEQMLNSHEVDCRADIYSLGIVLYEMLTGVRPNKEDTAVQLMARAVAGELIPDVRKMRPEVSASVAHLISMMCAMNIDERISTPTEVVHALVDIANGKKFTDQTPKRIARRVRRFWRIHSRLVIGMSFSALVAAGAAVFFFAGSAGRHPTGPAAWKAGKADYVTKTNELTQMLRRVPRSFRTKPDSHGVSLSCYIEDGEAVIGHAIIGREANRRVFLKFDKASQESFLGEHDDTLSALEDCTSANVKIPGRTGIDEKLKVTKLGSYAFNNVEGLRSVTFDEGVKHIGSRAFFRCPDLETVILPDSVEAIDLRAFFECPKLSRLKVGANFKPRCGFIWCCPKVRIELSPRNRECKVRNGSLYAGDFEVLVFHTPTESANDLPKSLRHMMEGSCALNPVRDLVLPDSLESVDAYAFIHCTNMQTAAFCQRLSSLGPRVFGGCGSLKTVRFAGSVPETPLGHVFEFSSKHLVVVVRRGTKGWNGPNSTDLPATWMGRSICYEDEIETRSKPVAVKTRTITLPGGAKMEMVWCPPGEFDMGSAFGEIGREPDEMLHRVVFTNGFWIGKYEVTMGQWRSVMGFSYSNESDNMPVEGVSWNDCQQFLDIIKREKHLPVALPTEAQWEYACRAGTRTPFSFGWSLNGDEANCDGRKPFGTSQQGRSPQRKLAGGRYPPNAWGIHDMHGNIWEWCSDWYGDYPAGVVTNPAGPVSGAAKILRGGAWDRSAASCRSANRDFSHYYQMRTMGNGMRICCAAMPDTSDKSPKTKGTVHSK